MKRSTTRWTTALAAVALLGLPAAGLAQTAASPPQQQQPATAQSQQDQPGDHLRAAKAALAEIDDASVTGRAKTQLTQLKQHLNALERAAAAKSSAAGKAPAAQARSNNWSTEVSAADKILTELLRPASASGTAGATGTSGTTGAAAAVTLDDVARAKLTEVRTHLTKFAAAMSGSAVPSSPATSTPPSQPPTSQPPTSQPPTSQPPTSQPPTSQPPTSQPPTSQPPTSQPDDPQQPAAQAQVDTEAVRRHLTEARETLSEMTQLPAAATLAGDTRTQVNALIANFNELITNQTDWRASYQKVEDNLNALIGPENPVAAGAPPTGTAGAVGTSGTPTLDAEIRAKLVELRAKLNEFERAAGGASPAGAASAGAAASTASRPPSATSPSAAQDPSQGSPVDRAEALRLIAAIEGILNGTSPAAPGTAGTSGTTASPTTTAGAPLTLSRTQVEQLRTHLNELRRVVGEK